MARSAVHVSGDRHQGSAQGLAQRRRRFPTTQLHSLSVISSPCSWWLPKWEAGQERGEARTGLRVQMGTEAGACAVDV